MNIMIILSRIEDISLYNINIPFEDLVILLVKFLDLTENNTFFEFIFNFIHQLFGAWTLYQLLGPQWVRDPWFLSDKEPNVLKSKNQHQRSNN